MIKFNVYANGIFWGQWVAATESEAVQMAADEVGTEGNTAGLIAEVST